jgi:hypothetical protein
MSALRKVLSEDRDVIKTVHGCGYVFASEVTAAPPNRMPLTAPWGPFARSATGRHKPATSAETWPRWLSRTGSLAEPCSFGSPRYSLIKRSTAREWAYEWHDDSGNWFRSYGNENWEFDEHGLMRLRIASINDVPINEGERKYHWPLGRRPDDHASLSGLGL